MRGNGVSPLLVLFCLLPLACAAPERSGDPLENSLSDEDQSVAADEVDPRVEEWLALLPEEWRVPEGLDPQKLLELQRAIAALPELPEIDVRIAPAVSGILSESEFDASDLDLLDLDPLVEPTEEGNAQLAAWCAQCREHIPAIRSALESLKRAPRNTQKGEFLDLDSWPMLRQRNRLSVLLRNTESDFEAWIGLTEEIHTFEQLEASTLIEILLTQANRVTLRRGFQTRLSTVSVGALTRWIEAGRRIDQKALFSKLIRGEISLAILPGLPAHETPPPPGVTQAARDFFFPDNFDALIEGHPNALDPEDTIARLIEVAAMFEASSWTDAAGKQAPPILPPPSWLVEVTRAWPEEESFFTMISDYEGWGISGDLSVDEARRRLGEISNPVGKIIAAHVANIAAETSRLIERIETVEAPFRAACAVTLFERRTGHFPESWAMVVAAGILSEIPLDPFADRPLELLPEQRVVRSVGNDGVPGPIPQPWDLGYHLNGETTIFDRAGNPLPDDTSTDDIVYEIGPLEPLPRGN